MEKCFTKNKPPGVANSIWMILAGLTAISVVAGIVFEAKASVRKAQVSVWDGRILCLRVKM